MIENARDFLRGCRGRTVVVYDTDGDGLGAAAIIAKTLKGLFKKYPKAVPRDHGLSLITDRLVSKIKDFDNIIFLDIAADEKSETVMKLVKKSRVIVIDHHQIRKNLGKGGVLHVNPVFWEKKIPSSQYCTSKITYDICRGLVEDDFDWLAGIGVINDKAEKSWKGFLKSIYKKYKISPKIFELVNDIITSPYMFSEDNDLDISYKACLESSSPTDILESRNDASRKLRKYYDIIEKEIKSAMKTWKKDAEIFEDKKLILIELKTKFSINSVISTKISFEKPHYTVLVARMNGKHVSASLRRQDKKVNCGELARKLTRNIKNSSGGGHVPAAGIKILKKDWKQVRNRVLEKL
jgi:single-stranded DNA-specific DHH superfamily exonuclease